MFEKNLFFHFTLVCYYDKILKCQGKMLREELLKTFSEKEMTVRLEELMKKKIALILTMITAMALSACGSKETEAGAMVYAVEAGSAGESAAKEKGFEYHAVASQADALMEIASGTSDAGIIDLLMAGAMIGEGTSYPDLIYTEELTKEEYGVGCRKGSELAAYINAVFAESYEDGSMQEIAEKYGVQEAILEQAACEYPAVEGDLAAITEKGTLIVGITEFAPMDYKDESGEWIGFDADMAKLVAQKLGVEVQFVVIDWDSKIMELDSGNIDVVWNGMTLTDEVTQAMECTKAYCKNAQVVVVPEK